MSPPRYVTLSVEVAIDQLKEGPCVAIVVHEGQCCIRLYLSHGAPPPAAWEIIDERRTSLDAAGGE